MKKLIENRNKLKNNVVRMFFATTQRIFACNDHNITERIIRWSTLTKSIIKFFEIESVYSMQILKSLLLTMIDRSERTTRIRHARFLRNILDSQFIKIGLIQERTKDNNNSNYQKFRVFNRNNLHIDISLNLFCNILSDRFINNLNLQNTPRKERRKDRKRTECKE